MDLNQMRKDRNTEIQRNKDILEERVNRDLLTLENAQLKELWTSFAQDWRIFKQSQTDTLNQELDAMNRKEQEHWENVGTVSYTHLDVYKRQENKQHDRRIPL